MKTQSVQMNDQGFTLVELMVVVAIIGLLAAVAIPNFKTYQAKTKTSEAKLQLAAIYQAETTMQADYDTFASCLQDAGYTPPAGQNYYSVGFNEDETGAAEANAIVTNNGGVCNAGQHQFAAQKIVGGSVTVVGDLGTAIPAASQFANGLATPKVEDVAANGVGSAFVAGAIGYISPDSAAAIANASYWIIDENKDIRQVQRGY